MKKLTFLVTDKEYDAFIAQLQQWGVVHVVELQAGATSPELQDALALDARYKEALKSMTYAAAAYEKSKKEGGDAQVSVQPREAQPANGLDIVAQIEQLTADETATRHAIDDAEKAIAQLEPFGDFSWDEIHALEADTHCRIHFFRCGSKSFRQQWADTYFATPVAEENKKTYFVTFSGPALNDANGDPSQAPAIAAEHLELPEHNLAYYIKEKNELKQRLQQIRQQQLRLALEERQSVEAAKLANDDRIALARVQLSHEEVAEGVVRLMEGWVKTENADEVTKALDDTGIYYELSDPAEGEKVPIEIKNDSYSSLFEPILKMYSLPNYRDLDPTVFFAPFFMLFFGLCMGDAGYGLLILLICLWLLKAKPDFKPYAKLGCWLGATTMVVGLLTGSFFGIDLSQQDWAFLAPVKHLFINENNYKPFGYAPMMVFSVVIGLVQVLLGMTLAGAKAVKNGGWKYGVGKFSWVTALLSATLLFGLPACGVALPLFIQYLFFALIAVAAVGIMFYNNPDKNLFMNFGGGLWSIYGMATGLLGDLLSYIRLFALGLTGSVLGGVFNQLATDLTEPLPLFVRWLPMLLILLLGHGINFGLCMISSFVHPMRLTFVEFFKNADFEGGGKPFTPFKKKTA
ncbi:MAG: ATPase [Bacteroidales bacterium]|nr:ATPase [Bacteroidales bacterium]